MHGTPVLAGWLLGDLTAGLIATLGAFTGLYGRGQPYVNRAQLLAVIALSLSAAVGLGMWAAAITWVGVLTVAATASRGVVSVIWDSRTTATAVARLVRCFGRRRNCGGDQWLRHKGDGITCEDADIRRRGGAVWFVSQRDAGACHDRVLALRVEREWLHKMLMPIPEGHHAVFERAWQLRVADIDPTGRLRFDAAARHIQDVGQDYMRELGFDESHPLWVVRRSMIDSIRPIEFQDTLWLRLWCSGTSSRWCQMRVRIDGRKGGLIESEAFWINVSAALGCDL